MKRTFYLIATLLLFQFLVLSQQVSDSVKTALVIIDIQDFYFPGEGPGLVNAIPASLNAKEVLSTFRDKKQTIVHVRHQTKKGFGIHKNVEPQGNEKVITKTEINAFQGTDLLEYLKSNQMTRLIIVGMQTQMCVEAAVRAGHDYGFECILIHDACATRDLKYNEKTVNAEDVQTAVLSTLAGGGYAKVIDLETFKRNTNAFLFQVPISKN